MHLIKNKNVGTSASPQKRLFQVTTYFIQDRFSKESDHEKGSKLFFTEVDVFNVHDICFFFLFSNVAY